MRTITKRELNQQTSRVLAGITGGESVVVTEHGVPKWRIEAVGEHPDPVERLRLEGRITPAVPAPRPWTGMQGPRRYEPAEVDALLNDLRGDR